MSQSALMIKYTTIFWWCLNKLGTVTIFLCMLMKQFMNLKNKDKNKLYPWVLINWSEMTRPKSYSSTLKRTLHGLVPTADTLASCWTWSLKKCTNGIGNNERRFKRIINNQIQIINKKFPISVLRTIKKPTDQAQNERWHLEHVTIKQNDPFWDSL
jgi:hypothetical protein